MSACAAVTNNDAALTPEHELCTPRKPKSRTRTSSYCKYSENAWDPDDSELVTLRMTDFEVMGVLGVGTYGVVKLAKHIRSGSSVALKVLSKEHVVSMRQEKHILRERMVHMRLRHPFIARLYGTFQDEDCLYLVIEYLPGGELWSVVYANDEGSDAAQQENDEQEPLPSDDSPALLDVISVAVTTSKQDQQTIANEEQLNQELMSSKDDAPRSPTSTRGRRRSDAPAVTLDARSRGLLRNRFGGLKEVHSAFYLACVLCALEYVHREDMLYRDLKLENLVLDRQGYPKVLDFGFAKPNAAKTSRNMTLCGSMDYMAPEILLHEPHDQRADVWSFGVLMYEMLLGNTPFYHDNPREQGRRITNDPVLFPADFEEEHPLACDLISRLLVKNPDERIRRMHDIKLHAFFARYYDSAKSWELLLKKQLPPPFVPKLSGPFDTSFFQTIDEEEEDELNEFVQPYVDDGSDIFSAF
ncbi:TPA: hypothetical protein N0F65_000917 [Lagenidium giganteum]|uniref:AGC protein kinase n=1 Tax=Lagenidium giganteum TaxID=4803 RepID=A0AAV2YKK7_9STRA|nr:TPA: hypothetical protein N0F65_000917 [Lagenidium giganteum]